MADRPHEPNRAASGSERRRHTRFKVAPMYTTVHVRRDGGEDCSCDGHLYDISEGGMRFELDEPLAEGETIRVEIGLPGCRRLIDAWGKVVRINSVDDDPGPRRMAVMFDRFADEESRMALRRYLDQRWLERAA